MTTTDQNDTICAISTPPGMGGVAVIRITGPEAIEAAGAIWRGKKLTEVNTHTAHLGTIIDPDNGNTVDQAVATVYRAPKSYTGENTVELSVHGSRWIQSEVLRLLTTNRSNLRIRLAKPGEFTQRAFTNGNLDLAQAEAVADLIAAESKAAHRIAINQMRGGFSNRLANLRDRLVDMSALLELELDFSEEDVEFADRTQLTHTAHEINNEISSLLKSFETGHAIRDGIATAIIGPTNAGKSSILNRLLDDNRAIVSDIHGTTRDIVEDTLTIGNFRFRLMDTAGIRQTDDTIEALGIERSRQAAEKSRIVIIVTPADDPEPAVTLARQLPEHIHKIILLNKTDILTPSYPKELPDLTNIIETSAKTASGINNLTDLLTHIATKSTADAGDTIVTNARHAQALSSALEASQRIIDSLEHNLPGDLVAQDLRQTIHHLSEITGDITTPQILTTIFSRFCIGK